MAQSMIDFAGERRGVWHPTDCIVQVIDDRADAEAVAAELRAHGIPADDILLLTGAEFVQLIEEIRRRIGAIKRLLVAANGSAEVMAQERYLTEARAGHCLVAVRIGPARPGEIGRDDRLLAIADVTAAHRAHTTTYYAGRGPRRLLPSPARPDFLGIHASIR